MTQPELHRPIPVERVGPRGLNITVEATPDECAALAERMHLPAIRALTCTFHLAQEGRTRVKATGQLKAVLIQTCVVTLENFESTLTEDFRVRFVPAAELNEDVDLDDDDEIPFENDTLDLGEAAAEQLGLALDPYPRKPGAELPPLGDEEDDGPFGALRRLNKLN